MLTIIHRISGEAFKYPFRLGHQMLWDIIFDCYGVGMKKKTPIPGITASYLPLNYSIYNLSLVFHLLIVADGSTGWYWHSTSGSTPCRSGSSDHGHHPARWAACLGFALSLSHVFLCCRKHLCSPLQGGYICFHDGDVLKYRPLCDHFLKFCFVLILKFIQIKK